MLALPLFRLPLLLFRLPLLHHFLQSTRAVRDRLIIWVSWPLWAILTRLSRLNWQIYIPSRSLLWFWDNSCSFHWKRGCFYTCHFSQSFPKKKKKRVQMFIKSWQISRIFISWSMWFEIVNDHTQRTDFWFEMLFSNDECSLSNQSSTAFWVCSTFWLKRC